MPGIILGYDGSETAKAALDQAAALSKELQAGLVLVFGYAARGYGGGEVRAQRDAIFELGEKVIAEGAERAKAAGVEAEIALEPMHPAHALIEAARKYDGRMIVVGSRGGSPIKGAILGSTSYTLLHTADVPVLVVPARDREAG
jgi:nucleotide-binding universal stress UspA family protein